jgi:hypothetical protein
MLVPSRVNVFDVAVLALGLLLVPLAYGSWLLFRPAQVHITSVTVLPAGKEEQRIANPLRAAVKLKVKGDGFMPMLRARIGTEPSLGFMFENPGSADVIVPPMAPGEYDVSLTDGGREVARAAKAYVVGTRPNADRIKVVGWLFNLDHDTASNLRPGAIFPSAADARIRVAALGRIETGRTSLLVQPGAERLEGAREGMFERKAALVVACDSGVPPDGSCTIGSRRPTAAALLQLPGPLDDGMSFLVDEVLPDTDAYPVDVAVRFSGGPELALITIGDRDTLLDDRAAVVTALGPRQGPGLINARLRLGGDRARDGWRYRNRSIKPGAAFSLATERYVAGGTVVAVVAPSQPVNAR